MKTITQVERLVTRKTTTKWMNPLPIYAFPFKDEVTIDLLKGQVYDIRALDLPEPLGMVQKFEVGEMELDQPMVEFRGSIRWTRSECDRWKDWIG